MDSEIRVFENNYIIDNKFLEKEKDGKLEIKMPKEIPKEISELKSKASSIRKINKSQNIEPKYLNYSKSNCFSRLFFYWPKQIFKIANKGQLKHEDVCNVSREQSIKYEINKIKKKFLKYNSGRFKKYSLVLTIFMTNFKLLFLLFILDIFSVGLDYVRMFFYRKIISIFSEGIFFPVRKDINFFALLKNIEKFPFNIIEVTFFYILIRITRTLIHNHIEFNNDLLASKITNQMIALLIEKIIKSNSYYKTGSIMGEGEMLNLAEVDAERIGSFFFTGPRILTAPIRLIISMILLFKLFGNYFFYALIAMACIVIIIVILQIIYMKNLRKLLFFKDKRMKIVTYVFHTLRCIKLNSLEDEFIKRIKEKRDNELKYIKNSINIDLMSLVINSNINLIFFILTLYFFAYSNKEIEISNLFVAFQLINSMTFPLLLIPFFFNRLFSNLMSVKRLQNFLKIEDCEPREYENIEEFSKDILVKFDNISFGINKNQLIKNKKNKTKVFRNYLNTSISSENPMPIELSEIKDTLRNKPKPKLQIIDQNENILLNNIFLSVKKSEFIAIIGSMGSGKTSLINAILNNYKIYMKDSKPIINGEISYCPQQPWIITDTIKNNILFYNKYDEIKYKKIISLCQLEKDLENFNEKDETMINSSSAGLSGGQKARICLARCLYKDSDLYLFDDPFSSIDNNVSQAIFQNSFCNYLKKKAKVLVTNDLTNLVNVDKVIYMEKGTIQFTGTFEEYKKFYSTDNLTLDFIKKRKRKDEEIDNNFTEKKGNMELLNIDNNLLEENGNTEKNPYINKYFHSNKGNSVPCKTYLDYIKVQGGFIVFIILIALIIFSRIIESYRRTFVPSLTKNYKELEEKKDKDTNKKFSTTLKKNLSWYLKISLTGFLINFISEFIINFTSLRTMRVIHEKMIYKLMKAPINLFHDIVPIGQIINHLTKDIEIVQGIVHHVNFVFKLIFSLLSSLVLCYIYNKDTLWFCPLIILVSFFLRKYYLKTGRYLARLSRISYSPIMTILNESIKGVDIIRTSHAENHIKEKMYTKLDERYGINLYDEGSFRWYNLRRSLSSQIFFGAMLFYMVINSKKFSAKSIAIILQATEDFINLLVNASMHLSQLEISMIGLERCKSLMEIETEKNPEKDITDELNLKNWPSHGKINFINFSASYRPDTPIILSNINIEIKPGEKIGIVGRTGSGKSSILMSLSRVIEAKSGKILIDDEDIKNINLEYLRDKLSIVAQDSFLIESTVRDNIDPLHKYTDEEILEVMNDFGLFPKNGNEKLDLKIKEHGKNLSLGEKQLISFVRAVIKKNKIIILDEATSSLDYETEKIIQNNLKKYFKDSTVIMIAHHLQMVKECEKILVIDDGKIIESGNYLDLLKDKNSKFYSLYIREEEDEE